MERLLNLLQEFYWEDRKFINENWLLTMTNWVVNLSGAYTQTYIISKQGWFIKWLVENDKIKPLRKFIGWETDEDEPYIQFDLVDQYIAYLSISDTPIEDLISYLK